MEEEDDPCGGRLVDPTPLLQNSDRTNGSHFSSLISRATSRRILRQPSMLVRETAAFQLEERHSDWTYSRPIVVLDVIWNLAFVLLSGAVLGSTARERPSTPLRVWVAGYALQCLLHVGFVYVEYRRRSRLREEEEEEEEEDGFVESRSSVPKRLESLNTIVSFLWWIIGFYWIVVGGQALLQDAPRLYWLAVVFLAFDVFFAIFCIALACVIGIALCCCLPCIIAFLYAIAGQKGASDADISILPRFRFRQVNREAKFDLENQKAVTLTVAEPTRDSIDEIALSPEDSECCICLSQYEDGAELHSLPCNHYFHSGCIVKWLRINATCPLCKYNIIKSHEQHSDAGSGEVEKPAGGSLERVLLSSSKQEKTHFSFNMYNIPFRRHFFFHVFAIYLIDPTVISNTSLYMLLQLRESEVYTSRLFGMYAVFCFPTLQNILLQLQNVCVMCFLDQRTPIFSI